MPINQSSQVSVASISWGWYLKPPMHTEGKQSVSSKRKGKSVRLSQDNQEQNRKEAEGPWQLRPRGGTSRNQQCHKYWLTHN